MAAHVIVTRETGTVGEVRWAALGRALDGQTVSGDAYAVSATDDGALLAAVDGLGHGPEAAEASREAVRTLVSEPSRDVEQAVLACHRALARTRGVVLSVVRIHRDTLSWAGVGNVEGILVPGPRSSAAAARLLLFGGVVGHAIRPPRITHVPIARGDLLVLATDGLRPEFAQHIDRTASPERVADGLMAQCRTGRDDALVLAARLDGGAP